MNVKVLSGILGLLFVTGFLPAVGAAAGVQQTSVVEPQHTSWINASNVPLDWCPGNAGICQDSRHDALLGHRTTVTMQCWVKGRANSVSSLWFYVTLSGHQGFVKAEYVNHQWLTSPYCGNITGKGLSASLAATVKEVNASLAATGTVRFGVSYPAALSDRQTMAAAPFYKPNSTTEAGWGSHYGWAGDCISYVAVSWHSSAVDIYVRNAIDTYNYYHSKMHPASLKPPRGALVFWHAYSGGTDYGHVMVSLGDGEVVGTQGWDKQYTLPTYATQVSVINSKLRTSIGWFEPA